jgi:hypothetical protein
MDPKNIIKIESLLDILENKSKIPDDILLEIDNYL